MSSQQSSIRRNISPQQIQKQILYWNISTLNNLAQYSQLINRVQTKLPPTQKDRQIRDFYFTNKLTLQNGKFQTQSFIQRSIEYMKNFKSLDKNSYLQSINFQNNIKKYRFWKNIVNQLPKDKQTHQAQQKINKIIWAYRLPTFIVFSSFIYIFMVGVGFTKMKKSKQFAMLVTGMYIADVFIQRRRSNEIFYSIPELQVKSLQRQRKQLINQSIVLDSKIYQVQQQKDYQAKQLIQQSENQQDANLKKILLEAAGFKVIDKVGQLAI